jgi:hypothetical protein
MKVISKIRVNKTTKQKTVNVPKQKETENWNQGDLVELNKVEIKS